MSVVNQMLKDLEQRNAEEQTHSAVYQAPASKATSAKLLLIIIALLCVAILIMAASWWSAKSAIPVSASTSPVVETIGGTPNQASGSQDSLASAKIGSATAELTLAGSEQQINKVTLEQAYTASATTTVTAQDSAQRQSAVANMHGQPEAASENTEVTSATTSMATEGVEQTLKLPQEADDIAAAAAVKEAPFVSGQDPNAANTAPVFKKSSNAQSSDLSLRDRALSAVRAGQDEQAITLLQQLIAVEPDNIAARKKLAAIYYARNELVNAQVVLERGIQAFPEDAGMRLMLARLFEQQQQAELAFSVVNPELPLRELSTEFLGFRAALADRVQNVVTAYNDYQLLTQREPTQARWWLGLAIASERQEKVSQALSAYQQALALRQLGPDVVRFVQQRMAILVEPS